MCPFDLEDVLHYAPPQFTELDGDGDLMHLLATTVHINFQNTGSSIAPAFAAPNNSPQAFPAQIDVGSSAKPVFADLDGDGDLDALIGNNDGDIIYFQNTGSSTDPAFHTASSNPFNLENVGWYAAPALFDLDGDGDLDAFIGNEMETIFFKTWLFTNPRFEKFEGSTVIPSTR